MGGSLGAVVRKGGRLTVETTVQECVPKMLGVPPPSAGAGAWMWGDCSGSRELLLAGQLSCAFHLPRILSDGKKEA